MAKASSADVRARRQVELALLLMDRGPVGVAEITDAVDGYAAEGEARDRAVRRDVAELAELGIAVVAETGPDGERRWRVDEDCAYADMAALGVAGRQAAAALGLALAPVARDATFVPARELLCALAKLAGRVGPGAGAARGAAAGAVSRLPRVQQALVDACGHAVEFDYVNATGVSSRVGGEAWGYFGLNGNLYVVVHVAWAEHDGVRERLHGLRPYRTDRVTHVPKVGAACEVPADFDARDLAVLPFQIGGVTGEAVFAVPEARRADVEAHAGELAWWDGDLLRTGYASLRDAATWAIGMDVEPVAPMELVSTWRFVLSEAARGVWESDGSRGSGVARRGAGARGRTGSDDTRDLLVALTTLFAEAPQLRVAEAAAALGVETDRARELLDLLATTSWGDGYLPLDVHGDVYALAEGVEFAPRRLRLTAGEAAAVDEALERVGVPAALADGVDELRAAFWPVDEAGAGFGGAGEPDEVTLDLVSSEGDSAAESELLRVCWLARAAAHGEGCRFLYQGRNDDAPQWRSVAPVATFAHRGRFYLSAYDFGRQAMRQFRVGRMEELGVLELNEAQVQAVTTDLPAGAGGWLEDAPRADLWFAEERMAGFFNWEGIGQLEHVADGRVRASVPDLGGDWLPRHIAAFGGGVTTSDETLAERVVAWAEARLG